MNEREKKGERSKRHDNYWEGGTDKFSAMKIPRQCQFDLPVKFG
jgi:hypothetical protein